MKMRPSPSMAVALAALFISITGVGVAAVKLKTNSVKAKQIAPGAVGTSEAADNALTGTDVNEGTLSGVAPAGAAGGSLAGSYPNPSLVPNEGWHEVNAPGQPAFENSWANLSPTPTNNNHGQFSTAAFRRDRDGLVYLKGVVTGGAPNSVPGQIFVLPAGYRPAQGAIFEVASGGPEPNDDGDIYVGATGSSFAGVVHPFTGDTAWMSLDGITFRCAPSGANGCP